MCTVLTVSMGFALSGCLADRYGTAVGNPGEADAKVLQRGTTVALGLVLVPVDRLWLDPCEGPPFGIPVGRELHGLVASVPPVAIPSGRFCGMALDLSDPVLVEGTTAFGTDFTLWVDIDTLAVEGAVEVRGDRVLFAVPLPVNATAVDRLGPDAVIDVDDPVARQLAEDVIDGVTLYIDADDDGLVSPPDRQVAAALRPIDDTGIVSAYSAQDAGCGCVNPGHPSLSAYLLGLAGLLLRRRRQPGLSERSSVAS